MILRTVLAVLLLCVVLPAARARAQGNLEQLDQRLEYIAAASALQGFGLDERAMDTYAFSGMLRKGEAATLVVELWAGRIYRITGVCDRLCSNVDLSLREPGQEVDLVEDRLEDSVPLLEYSPRTTGRHLLTVEMPECSREGCYYGVRILSK